MSLRHKRLIVNCRQNACATEYKMINNILIKVQADIKDLNQKLDKSAKDLDKWSKETMGGFTSLAKSIGVATLRFAAITAPITATGAAMFALMQKTANTGEELLRMKQKTGMTVEELYNLKQVAEFSDISLGDLDLRLKDLARNLFEARNKAGEARDIFKALGIDTSKSLNQVLMDLAKRFAEMEDGEDKLALTTQLFGRNGQDIFPVLNDLASGAHKVSGAFSEKAAKSAGEFNDNLTELRHNIEGLTSYLGNKFIPTANSAFDFFRQGGATGTKNKALEDLKQSLDAVGIASRGITDIKQMPFVFNDVPYISKSKAPTIITDEDRKKFVDNEQNMAKLVDDAGQKIIDNLNKRAEAYKKLREQQQTSREAEIQLQLKEIDLAEQEFRISKSGAVEERVRLYGELKRIQEEYLAGLDKVNDPASWYAQSNAINETREALVRLNLELKEQTGTFTEGFSYGFQKFQHDAKTSFQYGQQAAQDTATAMQDFFSSISFDAMQGKLKSLGDYFRSFLTSIQSSISNILGQLITQGIMTGISGLFSPAASLSPFAPVNAPLFKHSGGYIPRFHAGGLNSDERLIIGQTEEFMMRRSAVKKYGRGFMDSVNSGTYSPGSNKTSNNYFIIDPDAAEAYSKMSERQIEARITKLMKDNRLKQIRR